MKMNINYPAMVERAWKIIQEQGATDVTKQQLYTQMVKSGMMDENGQPTQAAIDRGLVEEAKPEEYTLAEFKQAWPVYAQFEDKHFRKSPEGWMADAYVIRELANQRLNDPDVTEEQRQVAYGMLEQLDELEGNK